MKLLINACMAGFVFLTAGVAHAGLVTYQFSASIQSMYEDDPASGGFPSVNASSVNGTLVRVGDTISGRLRYDTNAPPYTLQPAPSPDHRAAFYLSGAQDFLSYRIDRTGYTFTSNPRLNGGYLVWHELTHAPGSPDNSFTAEMNDNDSAFARNASLEVDYWDGGTLNGTAMPQDFDSSSFFQGKLRAGFSRFADDRLMGFDANLTSLTAVPEPGVPGLLVAGAVGMAVLRRRRGHGRHPLNR
jgi:hypothetical protein